MFLESVLILIARSLHLSKISLGLEFSCFVCVALIDLELTDSPLPPDAEIKSVYHHAWLILLVWEVGSQTCPLSILTF